MFFIDFFNRCRATHRAGFLRVVLAFSVLPTTGTAVTFAANDVIEQRIRERIAASPYDSAAWRLLGKMLHNRGDLPAALDAYQRCLQLDESSASAHYDLGTLLVQTGQPEQAIQHLKWTVELAPDGDYAADAVARLKELSSDNRYTQLVSFSVPWLDTPRTDDINDEQPTTIEPVRRWVWEVETGLLFNSNVELAPISRQLSTSELSSFQAYIAPEIEYRVVNNPEWRFATLLETYFNFNESHLEAFNLQHLQPGVYVDRSMIVGSADWVTRVQYEYSVDLFGGEVFGNRHLLTTSLTVFHEQPVTSIVYWAINYTDFQDDGIDPQIDSADGMTNNVGLSRSWETDVRFLNRFDIGADFQWAELTGQDQSYRGVFLYIEAGSPCVFSSELTLTGGWGYRDYPDFTGTPSRNENLIVAGIQVEKSILKRCGITIFFNYEDFASGNTTFTANRYTAGMYLTIGS